jgi:hypothetical protein
VPATSFSEYNLTANPKSLTNPDGTPHHSGRSVPAGEDHSADARAPIRGRKISRASARHRTAAPRRRPAPAAGRDFRRGSRIQRFVGRRMSTNVIGSGPGEFALSVGERLSISNHSRSMMATIEIVVRRRVDAKLLS